MRTFHAQKYIGQLKLSKAKIDTMKNEVDIPKLHRIPYSSLESRCEFMGTFYSNNVQQPDNWLFNQTKNST